MKLYGIRRPDGEVIQAETSRHKTHALMNAYEVDSYLERSLRSNYNGNERNPQWLRVARKLGYEAVEVVLSVKQYRR